MTAPARHRRWSRWLHRRSTPDRRASVPEADARPTTPAAPPSWNGPTVILSTAVLTTPAQRWRGNGGRP
ncbi:MULTISPECIES: hypothetical protein [Micromonospora]|uniref:hypothetical protein n=1 Tax=Micromonospora TaxID=1873 RepID=UPI0021C89161|nr:hypothetical protein [Micromonospora sp. MA102]